MLHLPESNFFMRTQSYKNHSRYVPGFHVISFGAILALLVGSFVNLYNSINNNGNLYSASLICLIAIILCLLFWYIRRFPIAVQDRVILSEENFRHYVLTGRRLDARLTKQQIIGLRFASDEEFPALCEKAAEENLSSKAIKQSITNWRADHNRA